MFQFGEYEYSARHGLVREGQGVPVPLPPKERALLELLLARGGTLVRHDEIRRKLWPNQSVSSAALTRCVYSLRKILGGAKSEYIVSLPKQGYRLKVAVTRQVGSRSPSVAEKIAGMEPRAYAEFLEGLREVNAGGEQNLSRAIQLFQRACRHASVPAVPWAAIADTIIYQILRGYVRPLLALPSGLDACAKALDADEQLASAYAARGWLVGIVVGDHAAGLADLDVALQLDDSYARAYVYRGWVHRAAGNLAKSVADARDAESRDPCSLMIRHALAWSLFCGGRAAEAEKVLRRLQEEFPQDEVVRGYLAINSAWRNPGPQSVAAAREAVRLSGNNPAIATALAYALARSGEVGEARRLAESLCVDEFPRAPPSHLAMTYLALGDFERALGLLRTAQQERCPWFTTARFDPRMDVAQEERFSDLFGSSYVR